MTDSRGRTLRSRQEKMLNLLGIDADMPHSWFKRAVGIEPPRLSSETFVYDFYTFEAIWEAHLAARRKLKLKFQKFIRARRDRKQTTLEEVLDGN